MRGFCKKNYRKNNHAILKK